MASQTIKFKRGLKTNLPSSANIGEPLYATDTKEIFIGNGDGQALTSLSAGAKVGPSGTLDYLSSSYFEQDNTNHIRILQNTLLTGVDVDKLDGLHGADYTKYTDIANFDILGFAVDGETNLTLTGTEKDTVNLVPVSSTFSYYFGGKLVTITGTKSVTLTDAGGGTHLNGIWYIYINDNTGTLRVSQTAWDIETTVPVAIVIWCQSNASGARSLIGDERHTCKMPARVHRNLHLTRGTQKISGGAITGYTVNTSTDAAITYGIDAAVIADEDLFLSLAALTDGNGTGANYTYFYHISTGVWGWKQGQNFPFGVSGVNARLQYDNPSTGLTEPANNRYINSYLFLTNFQGEARFSHIFSQQEYTSSTASLAETLANLNLTGLPFTEFVSAYQINWHVNNYGTTGKARIEAVTPITVSTIQLTSTLTSNDHQSLFNRTATGAHSGLSVSLDTTNFNKRLDATIVDVQKLADAVNNLKLRTY